MPEEKDYSREELLTLYASLPGQLAAAVCELSGDQLDLTGGPDEWSIRQIVHHLADGQAVWSLYIRLAIGAPGSPIQFGWYPGNDAWAERLHYAERSIEPSLASLQALHQETAESLTLIPDAWERQVIIGQPGSGDEQAFSVAQIVDFTAEHFAEHLDEIKAIRRNHDF